MNVASEAGERNRKSLLTLQPPPPHGGTHLSEELGYLLSALVEILHRGVQPATLTDAMLSSISVLIRLFGSATPEQPYTTISVLKVLECGLDSISSQNGLESIKLITALKQVNLTAKFDAV